MLNEIMAETGIDRGIITKHVSRVASQFSNFKDYYTLYGKKPEFKKKVELTDSDKEYIKKNYQHYSKRNGLQGISRQLGLEYDVVHEYVKSTL